MRNKRCHRHTITSMWCIFYLSERQQTEACKDYVFKLLAYGTIFSQLNTIGIALFCRFSFLSEHYLYTPVVSRADRPMVWIGRLLTFKSDRLDLKGLVWWPWFSSDVVRFQCSTWLAREPVKALYSLPYFRDLSVCDGNAAVNWNPGPPTPGSLRGI